MVRNTQGFNFSGISDITLNPEQERILNMTMKGALLIKGVAGSGKSTVALYRAKKFLSSSETDSLLIQKKKVGIFTYTKALIKYIRLTAPHINLIEGNSGMAGSLEIVNFDKWAYDFISYRMKQKNPAFQLRSHLITGGEKKHIVKDLLSSTSINFLKINPIEFISDEITWIKAQGYEEENSYVNGIRVGRGHSLRLSKESKHKIWAVFDRYCDHLEEKRKYDIDDFALLCRKLLDEKEYEDPYNFLIIDEAQDLTKMKMLVLSRLVHKDEPNLNIIADKAQKIYKSGFSWQDVGIHVRGKRTIELRRNYRNSHQISMASASLISKEKDIEFTTSIASDRVGPKPQFHRFQSKDDQVRWLLKELQALDAIHFSQGSVILSRYKKDLESVAYTLQQHGFTCSNELMEFDTEMEYDKNKIYFCSTHSIKGLEFNNVFVLNVNEGEFPVAGDETDKDARVAEGRHLLYTAMTRAKNRLYLCSSGTPSRYIDEIDSAYIDAYEN